MSLQKGRNSLEKRSKCFTTNTIYLLGSHKCVQCDKGRGQSSRGTRDRNEGESYWGLADLVHLKSLLPESKCWLRKEFIIGKMIFRLKLWVKILSYCQSAWFEWAGSLVTAVASAWCYLKPKHQCQRWMVWRHGGKLGAVHRNQYWHWFHYMWNLSLSK